jgi:hypothetical protein
MLTFPCGVICERCRGSPMGLGEKATFGHLVANGRLDKSLAVPVSDVVARNGSRCDLFIWLAMSCMISIIWSGISRPSSRQTNIPRASRMPSTEAFPSRGPNV